MEVKKNNKIVILTISRWYYGVFKIEYIRVSKLS